MPVPTSARAIIRGHASELYSGIYGVSAYMSRRLYVGTTQELQCVKDRRCSGRHGDRHSIYVWMGKWSVHRVRTGSRGGAATLSADPVHRVPRGLHLLPPHRVRRGLHRGRERELVGMWKRSAMQLDRATMVSLLLLLPFAFC